MNLNLVMASGLNQRNNKKHSMENDNNSCSLPHDVMLEILLRSSVKSLIQFKCVCKSWCSLISNPNFAKLHFDQALTPPSHRLLYLSHGNYSQPRCIDLDASLHHDYSVAPLSQYNCNSNTLGSCRGFLLLSSFIDFNNLTLTLWNPSTGTHKTIPHPLNLHKYGSLLSQHGWRVGFVYDVATDDYLVVLAFFGNHSGSEVMTTISAEIFSVRTKSWEEIQDVTFPYAASSKPVNSYGVYFNGVIHWIFNRDDDDDVIVCFDLGLRKFSKMDVPHGFWGKEYSSLMVVRGCLAVTDGYEIWVMEEYKVQSSWTMYFDERDCHIDEFFPQCHNNDGDIIGVRFIKSKEFEIVKFNYNGEQLEIRELPDHITMVERVCYRESLLSLPWNLGKLNKAKS